MRKVLGWILVCTLLVSAFAPVTAQAQTQRTPGGVPAFFIGCCFGLREGTMWNEGADLHWREWCTLIPYAGIVFAIWNGIDCAKGLTATEFQEQYGINWY